LKKRTGSFIPENLRGHGEQHEISEAVADLAGFRDDLADLGTVGESHLASGREGEEFGDEGLREKRLILRDEIAEGIVVGEGATNLQLSARFDGRTETPVDTLGSGME
jgi:hypothetical protein